MSKLKILGKYLDQPIMVAKFEKKVPYLLSAGGAVYTAHAVKKAKSGDRDEALLRVGITMLFTIVSALAAPKITNKLFKNQSQNLKQIVEKNTQLVDSFVKQSKITEKNRNILEKAKTKILNYKEIKSLFNDVDCRKALDTLVPDPQNIDSKEIFSEIGRLSLLGLIPVLGGIAGGIAGDVVTTENWKEKVPNKIKEGAYQYLANIFLCNIGAGTALAIMEKCGVKSKSTRALGMIVGILTTGVIGGSAIANYIGNKLINPIFGDNSKKDLYSERRPEALDIGLHTDDIATVAVMSGLKWIEPALPIMYAISGFRAGIGYRNHNIKKCNENNKS